MLFLKLARIRPHQPPSTPPAVHTKVIISKAALYSDTVVCDYIHAELHLVSLLSTSTLTEVRLTKCTSSLEPRETIWKTLFGYDKHMCNIMFSLTLCLSVVVYLFVRSLYIYVWSLSLFLCICLVYLYLSISICLFAMSLLLSICILLFCLSIYLYLFSVPLSLSLRISLSLSRFLYLFAMSFSLHILSLSLAPSQSSLSSTCTEQSLCEPIPRSRALRFTEP